MWPNSQFPADLVTFTEEIPNGKLPFLCSGLNKRMYYFPDISMSLPYYLAQYYIQRRNPVKHLRWSVFQKHLDVFSQ